MKKIYLDFAATTPMDKRVMEAMKPYFSDIFGNAGSLHSFGQEASGAIFKSRRKIADILGAHYEQIVFTGSATEANNLALQGIVNRSMENGIKKPKVVVSAIEHESVFEAAKASGAKVVKIPVSKAGQIDMKKMGTLLDQSVVLVSVIYANNEVGSIQNIKKISKLVREKAPNALMHTDCVQAFQYLDCKPEDLGVDLMTLSSHKIYGPKGIGLLYVKDESFLSPIIFGGGQEDGLRSGTENVASIVGFAKAIEIADKMREKESGRVSELRDWFLKELKKVFPKVILNGSSANRLANNLNIRFEKLGNEEAMTFLDLNGVAVSAGSACSARSLEASKTLLALGLSEDQAKRSLRISFGRKTNKDELKRALSTFKKMKRALEE